MTTANETLLSGSDRLHQIEDAALKITGQFFADELLSYFQIEGEVDHIAPTELIHLELKKLYEDLNLVMKDGSWIHFEFQSTDNGILDLKRFRIYEALTSHKYNVAVKTYVLYSGLIEHPVTSFTEGFNTYRVQPIIMKGYRAEQLFDDISRKQKASIPLTTKDLVPLTLCPLMGGDLPQQERIQKAIRLVAQSEDVIENARQLEAVIYAMASKFLNQNELQQIKEELKMTELGLLLYNDGVAQGMEQGMEKGIEKGISQGMEREALSNSKNLFLNGVPFELVRKSITNISEEALRKVYDEVMAEKQ